MEPWSSLEKRQVFAVIFDALLKRLGETQESLARTGEMDQSTLSRWRNLRVQPRRLEFRDLLRKSLLLNYEDLDAMLWLAGHRPLDPLEVHDHFGQTASHRPKTQENLQLEAARFAVSIIREVELRLPDNAMTALDRALVKAGVEDLQYTRRNTSNWSVGSELPRTHYAGPSVAPPFQSLIEDKTAGFVGRDYVFEAITSFLSSQPNGYFIIEGDPGVGKSAILAEYVRRTGCVAHFNVRSQGINRTDQFLESVCAQLIDRYGLHYSVLPPNAARDGAFLGHLLDEVSARIGPGEQLTIAVDALDEVELHSQQSGPNILYLPSSLPRGIYFLITRRPVTLPLTIHTPHQVFDLMEYKDLSSLDVQTFIRQAIARPQVKAWIDYRGLGIEVFIATLGEKSEYNFMYLRYVLADIEDGIYQDLSIDHLPRGLEGYYEDHWRGMGMAARPLPRTKIRVVYIMAEIREPVSRRLISEIASQDELTIQEVLDEWKQFLHQQQVEGQILYSLYHASFRDFLHRKDTVQAAGVTIGDINLQIADNLWDELFRDE